MKLEERLLHLGSLLVLVGVPLACSTALADAVEVPKSACFLSGSLLVVLAWLLGVARGSWPWFRVSALTGVFVALYAWWAASSLWGLGGLRGQIPALEHLLSLMLLLAWTATGNRARWQTWGKMLTLAGVVVTLYAWLQRFGLDPMGWDHPEYSRIRTISTMGNPNYEALYLVGWLALSLPTVAPRRWLWPFWLLGFAALVQTGTRGAWLACAVSLLVALALRPGRRVAAVGASMALAAGLVIMLGAPVLSERTQAANLGNIDAAARIYLWKAALSIASRHPLGVGPGGFTFEALQYRQYEPMELRPRQRLPENPHNELLSVVTEAGWPGLALLLIGLGIFLAGRLARARVDLVELSLLLAGVGLSVHLLTLSFTLSAEVLWLAALARAGRHDPPSSRTPPHPWLWVVLAGLVWLGGTATALGWVMGERLDRLAEDEKQAGLELLEHGQSAGDLLDRAVAHYGEAEKLLQPQRRADAVGSMGDLYARLAAGMGNDPRLGQLAMSTLAEAIRLDPRNPYRLVQLGLLVRNQKGSGEELLRLALGIDPRNPAFWTFLGEDQLQRGQLAQAEESYRRSLEIYPEHAGTLYRHGDLLRRLGRTEEGRRQMEQARRLDPQLPEIQEEPTPNR